MAQDFRIKDQIFTFDDTWSVSEFDTWKTFRRVMPPLTRKGCDLVAIQDTRLLLIEAKDYTFEGASPPQDLPAEVCRKAMDTLALLLTVSKHGSDDDERAFSAQAVGCTSITVCLNVELAHGGRGSDRVVTHLANYKQQIRRLTKTVTDGKPIVSSFHVRGDAPWTVRRDPSTRGRHADR